MQQTGLGADELLLKCYTAEEAVAILGIPLARIIRELASCLAAAPSPCPSPVTRCIGKSNGSPGEGIKECAPLPGTPWVWERAPRGYPVRVSGGIRE